MSGLVPLEEACELVTDGTHFTPTNVGKGRPFLTVKDVSDSGLDFVNCSFISDDDYRAAKEGNSAPQLGDVLFSKDGTVGKVHVVTTDRPFAVLSSLAILRPIQGEVDAAYLGHALRSPQVLDDALRKKTGSAIRRIVLADLKRVHVPLPSLPEQRRIAEVLDRAEALRAKRRAALAQLDTLTQSIFRDMFGDIRGPSTNLPVVQFEDIVAETRLGLVRGSQELGPDLPVPYVRMNAITRAGELDLASVQRTRTTRAEFDAYRLRTGDLLFNTRNSEELVGKTALYRGDGSHVFNNNIMRIRFTGKADPEFVAAAFNTSFVQRELSFRKSGTTSVFAIYYKDLRSLPFPAPAMELQREFARRVGAMLKLKMAERSGMAQLDSLFSALQHRAFQGER